MTELWENFLQNRKILKKKNLLLSKGCVIIIERDCTRYAMKQEVAATGGEFLPSMSDFKPGDKNTVDMLDALL